MCGERTLLKVGSYTPKTAESDAIIDRKWYGQGWIVKDEDAFLNHPDKVCYVPELSDSTYTREDLLELCNGQSYLAEQCFYSVDWQHPETWIEDQYACGEWEYCPHCEKIFAMEGEDRPCPVCGWRPDND